MSKHTISVTREMGDPDLGAEETVEITFLFRKGAPEQGPSYASGGQPADPSEVEFVSAKPEFPDRGDWYGEQAQKAREEWARDFIEGGDHDSEIMKVVNSDDAAAREYAAELKIWRHVP